MFLVVVYDNVIRVIYKVIRGLVFKKIGYSILKKVKVLFFVFVWVMYYFVDFWIVVE